MMRISIIIITIVLVIVGFILLLKPSGGKDDIAPPKIDNDPANITLIPHAPGAEVFKKPSPWSNTTAEYWASNSASPIKGVYLGVYLDKNENKYKKIYPVCLSSNADTMTFYTLPDKELHKGYHIPDNITTNVTLYNLKKLYDIPKPTTKQFFQTINNYQCVVEVSGTVDLDTKPKKVVIIVRGEEDKIMPVFTPLLKVIEYNGKNYLLFKEDAGDKLCTDYTSMNSAFNEATLNPVGGEVYLLPYDIQ